MINELVDLNRPVEKGDIVMFLLKSGNSPINAIIKQLTKLEIDSTGKIIVVIGSGFNVDELTQAVQMLHLHEKKIALAWDNYPENHIEKIVQKIKEMS